MRDKLILWTVVIILFISLVFAVENIPTANLPDNPWIDQQISSTIEVVEDNETLIDAIVVFKNKINEKGRKI